MYIDLFSQIHVHVMHQVQHIVCTANKFVVMCTRHTSALIVTLDFTAIPALFLVSLSAHYHPVTIALCMLCSKHMSTLITS